jgi:AraC family transcriptional regulator
MELFEDQSPVYYNNLKELMTAAILPQGQIVGISAESNNVQAAIYQMPPMQAGVISFQKHTFSIALTDLDCLELSADNVTYTSRRMKVGDWIFVPSNYILYSRWKEDTLCMHLYLDPIFVNSVAAENLPAAQVNFKALIDRSDPTIGRFLELFKQEFAANRLTDILYTEALARALTIHLIRRYADNHQQKSLNRRVYLDALELQKTIESIEQNLDQAMTVQQLAQAANVSISVFAHSFKKAMGISPYKFILKQRLQKSQQLLLDSDPNLSIAAIARICGFANASVFTTRFRQNYDISPSQYRGEYQNQPDESIEAD